MGRAQEAQIQGDRVAWSRAEWPLQWVEDSALWPNPWPASLLAVMHAGLPTTHQLPAQKRPSPAPFQGGFDRRKGGAAEAQLDWRCLQCQSVALAPRQRCHTAPLHRH